MPCICVLSVAVGELVGASACALLLLHHSLPTLEMEAALTESGVYVRVRSRVCVHVRETPGSVSSRSHVKKRHL